MDENHEELFQKDFERSADAVAMDPEIPIGEEMSAPVVEENFAQVESNSAVTLDAEQGFYVPYSGQSTREPVAPSMEQSSQAPYDQSQMQIPQNPYAQYGSQLPQNPYAQYGSQLPQNPYAQYGSRIPQNPYGQYSTQSSHRSYVPPYGMSDPRMPSSPYPQNAPYTVNGYRVYRPMVTSKKQKKGLVSLILSAVGMLLAYFVPVIAIALGIVAIVLGVGCVKKNQEDRPQKIMGTLGLIFGGLAIVGSLVLTCVALVKLYSLIKSLMYYG